jgi:hypothetical protein
MLKVAAWLRVSGRDSQPDASLVAALVAEEKSANHSGALLRFVQSAMTRWPEPS